MRHCSQNNHRDVQSTELPRHRHLQRINVFLFFPSLSQQRSCWISLWRIIFTQPSETNIFHFDKITLFVLQIDLCLCKEVQHAKKRSKMKWNEREFDIKYCTAHTRHDLLLKAQPDFADFKLEVLFWFFFNLLHPSSCWGSGTSGNGSGLRN